MDEQDFWDLVFAAAICGGASPKAAEEMAEYAVLRRRQRISGMAAPNCEHHPV